MALRIYNKIITRSADVVLMTGFREDGLDGDNLINHTLIKRALGNENGLVNINLTLDRPLIGLGASAHQYLPMAAERLGIQSIIPEHAEVANAIGAVAGQIELVFSVTILQPTEGLFEVAGTLHNSFSVLDQAIDFAKEQARIGVEKLAIEAGASEHQIKFEQNIKTATIESIDTFIEGQIIARISARPAIGN